VIVFHGEYYINEWGNAKRRAGAEKVKGSSPNRFEKWNTDGRGFYGFARIFWVGSNFQIN
jgi:hypothetical protein